MARRIYWAAVCILSVALGTEEETTNLITQADRDAVDLAKRKSAEFCAGGWRGDMNRKEGYKALTDAAGGQNIVEDALKESESPSEVTENLRKVISPEFIIRAVGSIVMAFVAGILWYYFCWTSCPCCRCCRCGAKVRTTSVMCKIVLLVMVCGLVIGLITAGSIAATGYNRVGDGLNNFICTSAQLIHVTLDGDNFTGFIGMMPLITKMDDFTGVLDDGSPTLTDIGTVLDITTEFSHAFSMASDTLALFSDMLGEEVNVNPRDGGVSLLHTCTTCQATSLALGPLSAALADSAAKALNAARSEVDQQISAENRASLKSSMRSSLDPIAQMKKAVRDAFVPVLEDNSFDRVKTIVSGSSAEGGEVTPVSVGVGFIIFLALLLACCGVSASLICVLRPLSPPLLPEQKEMVARYDNNLVVSGCSLCTWCCGFYYIGFAFFFGGLILVLLVPLSSVCLLMADLTGAKVVQYAGALGMNMSSSSNEGDSSEMITDMIDRCFVNYDYVPSNLMDILFVTEEGNKVYMRQKIETDFKDPLVTTFAALTDVNMTTNMADSNELATVMSIISSTPLAAGIRPSAAMSSDSRFTSLLSDPDLVSAFTTSMNCASAEAGVIPGIDDFVSKLQNLGTLLSSSTCARRVTCSDPSSSVCTAGNEYVDLKNQILSLNSFRCDLFEDPDNPNAFCDPATSSSPCGKVVDGVWTTRRKLRSCTFSEFTQYFTEFATRIENTIRAMDDLTPQASQAIGNTMRNLVEDQIIAPIDTILNGATCAFLTTTYRGTIDSLCFQGVRGFYEIGSSYVACGSLAMGMTFVMYGVWRRGVDNLNGWNKLIPRETE